jgi:hypothetical protein
MERWSRREKIGDYRNLVNSLTTREKVTLYLIMGLIAFVTVGYIFSIYVVDVHAMFVVFASESSPYDSGYDHGCGDARISDPDDRYINKDGKGPSNHTDEFMNGYNSGYNNCSGNLQPQPQDQSQAQSQTSNNENNNENSLSQSQAATIYVCKENGCTAQ